MEGTSSKANSIYCGICMETKQKGEMFSNNECKCNHSFCKECVGTYLATKIQDNKADVSCPIPNCRSKLEPEICRSILSKDLFDRWENAICEAMIHGSQKFYCPFKDCSALLVNDAEEVVTASECPNCHRLFCAQCKVPWHAEINCDEFKNSQNSTGQESEDEKLMKLATNKDWKRCPSCNFYVEKVDGCLHVQCRCGKEFCYGCGGSQWSRHHTCVKCGTWA